MVGGTRRLLGPRVSIVDAKPPVRELDSASTLAFACSRLARSRSFGGAHRAPRSRVADAARRVLDALGLLDDSQAIGSRDTELAERVVE